MKKMLSQRFCVYHVVTFVIYISSAALLLSLIDSDNFLGNSKYEENSVHALREKKKKGNQVSHDFFITGDGFRSACHLVFSEDFGMTNEAFLHQLLRVANEMRAGQLLLREAPQVQTVSVFVPTFLIDKFIECCLRRIARTGTDWQILLVSHNSDLSSPYNKQNLRNKNKNHSYDYQIEWVLDNPRIKAWYATNAAITHPKLFPIPIGIENRYAPYGKHIDVYCEMYSHVHARGASMQVSDKKLLLIAFALSSYLSYRTKVRHVVEKAFAADKENVTIIHQMPRKGNITASHVRSYLNLLASHHFVLTPRGNGMDTHRLWESLYMGCVPIVQRSTMDARLLSRLPVLLVDDFSQVTHTLLSSSKAMSLKELWRHPTTFNDLLNMNYWRGVLSM